MKGGELSYEEYAAIADFANNGFGGQNWGSFWWANPRSMQIAQLLFLAPNWSTSAFRIAGGNELMAVLGLGPEVHSLTRELQWQRYWPGMLSGILMGWPTVLQAMVYGIGQAFGEGDDDDELFCS